MIISKYFDNLILSFRTLLFFQKYPNTYNYFIPTKVSVSQEIVILILIRLLHSLTPKLKTVSRDRKEISHLF